MQASLRATKQQERRKWKTAHAQAMRQRCVPSPLWEDSWEWNQNTMSRESCVYVSINYSDMKKLEY